MLYIVEPDKHSWNFSINFHHLTNYYRIYLVIQFFSLEKSTLKLVNLPQTLL